MAKIINSNKNIKFDCVDTWRGPIEHASASSLFFQSELVNDQNWLYEQFLNNIQPVEK